MKNFILRLTISYLLCAILFVLNMNLVANFISAYDKVYTFKLNLILFYIPADILSTILFYFLIGSISKKLRLFFLILVIFLFSLAILLQFDKGGNYNGYLILLISQLIIPNFCDKEHVLDKKINIKYFKIILPFLYLILAYFLLFYD